jgi:hypothetical protein
LTETGKITEKNTLKFNSAEKNTEGQRLHFPHKFDQKEQKQTPWSVKPSASAQFPPKFSQFNNKQQKCPCP